MSTNRKRISNKQNRQIMGLEIFLLILLIVAVAVMGFLLYRSMHKKKSNDHNSSAQDSSSVIEIIPEDEADVGKLAENFTYVSLDASYKNTGMLCLGEDSPSASRGDLQPVYNAVFTRNGLQIASVRDSKITCRNDMIIPLNEILVDFYTETGLRTVMIDRGFIGDSNTLKYEPDEESEETDDGGFYDPDGNYITFGYTDEYGNFYDDGYYDSEGNYMGYGYYDEEGNYIPYEEMAAASSSEPKTVNSTVNNGEASECGGHDDGYSIDLSLYFKESGKIKPFDGTEDYSWFTDNSWKYGFIIRFPEGKESITGSEHYPAHFRYVGRTAARVIHDNDIALDELAGFMQSYNYDSPLTVNSLDGTAIFYSIADPGLETTDIQVPADSSGEPLPYSVSDTGSGYYLITVILPDEYILKNAEAQTETSSDSTEETDSVEITE